MKINKIIEINIPKVPNFIITKDGKQTIAVKYFTEKELKEIGRLWTVNLIDKAKGRPVSLRSKANDN